MLDQIRLTSTVLASVVNEAEHRIPLVVAGEQRDPLAVLVGGRIHEPGQQIEPGIPLPHVIAQVTGPVAVPRRVACPVTVAAVERQKPGGVSGQLGSHQHLLGIDREMHDGPTQQRILRVPVAAVLLDRIVRGLVGQVGLQLGRGDRNAVHEQPEIDRLRGARIVRKLPSDGQPVGPILGL